MGKIEVKPDGNLIVPDNPVIPYIEGDGVGPDIWRAAQPVLDASVGKAYQGARKIEWREILAGEKSHDRTGQWLPEETLDDIREYKAAIKGPMTTPVGGGMRSLNVALRKILDLYACVRPVKYVSGVPAPVKAPEKVDMVIFRENTEDVYAGIEWAAGTDEARRLIEWLNREMDLKIDPETGLGLKIATEKGTKRLVRRAINYALAKKRKSVTLVHKGNIMKYTEGAFRAWGYEAAAEFGDRVITEADVFEKYDGRAPDGRGGHQGSYRRRHVPAGAAQTGRIRRSGHAQPERRLSFGRLGGPSGRIGPGPGGQHR